MRFLIAALLPPHIAEWLNDHGHDAIHVQDLKLGNRTIDIEIATKADLKDRIVISKDVDFLKLNVAKGIPKRILYVSTGNIRNAGLLSLFALFFAQLIDSFERGNDLIALSNTKVSIL